VLVLGLGVWSATVARPIRGLGVVPACLVPAAASLWIGLSLVRARLPDRLRARLFGAAYAAGAAAILASWHATETGRIRGAERAWLAAGTVLALAAGAFAAGRLWSRRAARRGPAAGAVPGPVGTPGRQVR